VSKAHLRLILPPLCLMEHVVPIRTLLKRRRIDEIDAFALV
jgi:hypothetical protein